MDFNPEFWAGLNVRRNERVAGFQSDPMVTGTFIQMKRKLLDSGMSEGEANQTAMTHAPVLANILRKDPLYFEKAKNVQLGMMLKLQAEKDTLDDQRTFATWVKGGMNGLPELKTTPFINASVNALRQKSSGALERERIKDRARYDARLDALYKTGDADVMNYARQLVLEAEDFPSQTHMDLLRTAEALVEQKKIAAARQREADLLQSGMTPDRETIKTATGTITLKSPATVDNTYTERTVNGRRAIISKAGVVRYLDALSPRQKTNLETLLLPLDAALNEMSRNTNSKKTAAIQAKIDAAQKRVDDFFDSIEGATETPAAPPLNKIQNQADIDLAIEAANKAIANGKDPEAVKNRLKEMGIQLKE